MKLKKLTILAGATLLASLLTLTSCGDSTPEAEDIKLASYSTEITIDDYQKAHDKYAAIVNIEAGYDFTSYNYVSNITTSKDEEKANVSYEKLERKYDKANSIATNDTNDYSYTSEPGNNQSGYIKTKAIIQKNGDKIEIVNELAKSYFVEDGDFDLYVTKSMNVANFVDTLTGSVAEGDTTKTIKYYNDNDVYTLKVNINTTDEREESGIKFKETVSSETIFQFYVSETEVYGKYTFDKTTTLDYTDGDKTGTYTIKTKNVKYADLKIGAVTLSKIDTSKYQKSF